MVFSRLTSNAELQDARAFDSAVATSRLQVASAVAAANDAAAADVAAVTGGSPKTIADLDAQKQPIDADLTAIAALVTLAFGRDFLTLADAAAARVKLALGSAAPLDADIDGTLAANSDVRIATQKAVRTYVAAQIAALINAAPVALDTLKELADALGDDANFAATVTTALAGKQPLDADLTAIAALATTAFGRGLLTLANGPALTAALGFATQVKTAAYAETAVAGEIIALCNLAGGFQVTLPAAAGNAAKLTFKNLRGDGPITIAAAGADTIDGNASILLSTQWGSLTLVSDGVSAWGII